MLQSAACYSSYLQTLIQPLLIASSSVKDSDDLERDKMKAQTLPEEREATMDLPSYKHVEAATIFKGV
jgi:hypothetical protein